MFKSAAKGLKEVDDEPILEEIEVKKESKEPSAKSTIDQIKAQAREKADKEMADRNNVQSLLDKFKRFLSKEKRSKFIILCEKEDSAKLNFINMMAFSRVLKNMGFRLLFDEVKNLIITLNVYDSNKDRVFYFKVISSAFRKLYRKEPYMVPPKPSQLQAIVVIQRYLREKKKRKNDKFEKRKESITPKDILNGLAQKIQTSGKPLLRSFEEIDKDHSGFIEINELDLLFQSYSVLLSQEHLFLVFKLIDTENQDRISYRNLLKAVETFVPTNEDLLAAIALSPEEKQKAIQGIISSIKLLFKESKMTLDSTFKLFDKDSKGAIDLNTFTTVILKITNGFSQFEIRQVFAFIDSSRDGFISKVEFSRVFFDHVETPAEILKRKEAEEQKRIESEIKAKWEQDRNSLAPPQVKEEKPTLLEEIKKKQAEAEEAQRKEALKKIDPRFAELEEKRKIEKEIEERRKKELEEKAKIEAEKKKKTEEDKKKREQEEKVARGKMVNVFKNLGKPKEEPKLTPKRSGSQLASSRSNLKKKETVKKTLDEKAGKLLPAPSESAAVLRQHQREMGDMVKKEFIYPLIEKIVSHGESIFLAREGQKVFENRGVIKHVFKWNKDWSQEVINPVPRTLWASGELGRVGFMDDNGYLNQLDVLTGSAFPVLHLGTKPPFQRTPLLAAACDASCNRLYLLNKQWVLEVWDLHQPSTSARKRVKILSIVVADDYVEKFYKNRHRNVFPKLIVISHTGKIVVNATCVDGFFYFFEPISMTLISKLRLNINELRIPEPILQALEEFSYFIRECTKLGISQQQVFDLLDRNGDGQLSFDEFKDAAKQNRLPITENQIRAMFKIIDVNQTGTISIDEFWGALYMKNEDVLSKETARKEAFQLPEWVNNINANERARDCMYKLYRAIESRSMTAKDLFDRLDSDRSGSLSRNEFSKGILNLLAPLITISDCELLLQIADRDNSGNINYKEFCQFLSLNKLPPGKVREINSEALPRGSMKYVIHKCLELGIDFYKICKENDTSRTGSLTKEIMSSILLALPVGLTLSELKIITERDLSYTTSGWVDYQEIFDREEYVYLIKQVKRPGVSFEIPVVQEEAAIVEDFEYIEDLGLVAFSTNSPVSSVIYIKSVKGYLVAKCVGHFGDSPPVLSFVRNANTLVSGERREFKDTSFPSLPPCCIILWNLQRDLISKYSLSPPWTIKPYFKVYAHQSSILDLTYLPITQLLVSTASDGSVKLWNPTGRPYALTETHHLPIASEKPGVYKPLTPQYTTSNALLTCVGQIVNNESQCFRVLGQAFDKTEWLVCLNLIPTSSKSISGNIQTWGFKRLNVCVPAKQHDWEVPRQIHNDLFNLFVKHRQRNLTEYRAGLAARLETILNNYKVTRSFEKEVKTSIIRSIIFEGNYENCIKIIAVIPERLKKGKVSPEEFYNFLIAFAGFSGIPYLEYMRILEEIAGKIEKDKEKPDTEKKPHVGLLNILQMIEDKKNPELKISSPAKSTALISKITADKKKNEQMFDTPLKDLEQELFEYLASRIMKMKISIGKLFEEIDQNQDALIDANEFSQFLSRLGYNLRKSEVRSIMKCIDYNTDGTVSFKELELKLKAFGYNEEWQPQSYSHEWEDESVKHFFKNFEAKNEFRNVLEHLKHFDYNKDGNLTPYELLKAISSVDKIDAERIFNILLVASKDNLSITEITRAITVLEKEMPKKVRQIIDYKSFESLLQSQSSVEVLRKAVENLVLYCLNINLKVKRGLELISCQFRLSEGLSLLFSARIRYQELIDYLVASSLNRLYYTIFDSLIKKELNVLPNTLQIEASYPVKIDPADFKVLWDEEASISHCIKLYPGNLLPSMDSTHVYVYDPEGLKHASRDGSSLYSHVMKELGVTLTLQQKMKELNKLIGFYEKYLGHDKTIFTVYAHPEGFPLKALMDQNGGLLRIPLLYNTKVSVFLLKYWGRKVLNIINTLQSYSISIRHCPPSRLYLNQNGSEILLANIQGFGLFDQSGKIVASPDLNLFIQGNLEEDPYVAPEFYLSNTQTSASDTWTFGVLMYHLLFGSPPEPYLRKYEAWKGKKLLKGEMKSSPAKSFPFNIYENLEVVSGQATETSKSTLHVLRTLRSGSFSGLVYDSALKSEIDEIETTFKTLKDSKNTKFSATNEIGKTLDVLFLCLQVDPAKRPTIRALLNSPAFTLDKYEEKQAKSFASLIFEHKNPEIVITASITKPLRLIRESLDLEKRDELINLIEQLGTALLSFEDSVSLRTSTAIFDTNLSGKEKDILSKKNTSSPITELSSQCIKDEVFSMIAYLALFFFSQGEPSVLQIFSNLLKYLLFHLNSEESGLSLLVGVLIETLLKLFMGEDSVLASKETRYGYVLKGSKWTPELYEIMAPIYRQSISESGQGQHNCPVIKEFLSKNRHPDYFSELMMIAENFNLVLKPESTTVAKRNALRHLKSMLQTRNEHKTLAALDFRLPQFVVHCLQDADYKVRLEAVEIFLFLTQGCVEPVLPKLPGVTKDYRSLGIINFFSVAKKETHETTKNFEKYASANDAVPASLKMLAECFESPIFVFPIVRLIKFKSEPYETKEAAVRILVSALSGSEKCQLACLSPVTDTISTLCKCLVVSEKTTDKKSGKNLAQVMKDLLHGLLITSRSYILSSFKNTPGAETLLKEQGLFIPDRVTLQFLAQFKSEPTGDCNIAQLVQGLKNWLVHEKTSALLPKEQEIITSCLKFLRSAVDLFWSLADVKPDRDQFIAKTAAELKSNVEKVKLALLFFEWSLFSDLDCGWFKVEDNVNWVIALTTHALQSAGSGFEVFYLEEETMILQRILCRLLAKEKSNVLLGKVKFGSRFAEQLILQYQRLGNVMAKHTEPLHILSLYPKSSEIRLASFLNLIQFSNLQGQMLESELIGVLVEYFLNDLRVLSLRFNKLSLDFLPFRETPPVRSEAINIVMIILKEKSKCKLVYDDLLLHLQRFKTIQTEVMNCLSNNLVLQATSLELVQAFIESKDKHIEYLLMQANAKGVLGELCERNKDLGMRFPKISAYCKD